MCYEEIEGMTLFVCRDVYMVYKIGAIEKVGKFDGLWVMRIVDMNVEVTGDDEVMGGCGSARKKRWKLIEKGGKRLREWNWRRWAVDVEDSKKCFGDFKWLRNIPKRSRNGQWSLEWWHALLQGTQCLHQKWFWTDKKQKWVGQRRGNSRVGWSRLVLKW